MAELASELQVDSILGQDGLIGNLIDGFQPRQSQIGMAKLIEQAIALGESRVIEASTGIGKSFAYLVPAFLSDATVVISTGTRNLQDQLFNKDIPLIREAIVSSRRVALLKGRSNYCCPQRVKKYRAQDRFKSREMASLFTALANWAEASETGDISEFSNIPENDGLWYFATSNADNCLGGECPELERCFVLKARRKAMDADLVVINHHLYFSDQTLKADGFGEILPEADVLIFDEAHQLPDIASHFYGQQLTLRQVETLCRDLVEAEVAEAPESRVLQKSSERLSKCAADFHLALRRLPQKSEWERVENAPAVQTALTAWRESIASLAAELEPLVSRGKELGMCMRRVQALRDNLALFVEADATRVSWYETFERGFRLAVSPLDVAGDFRQQLEQGGFSSVFFTSATLSSQRSFDYYCNRLGLESIDCASFDSPFDYASQAMLYVPRDLPDPSDDRFAMQFGELCLALLRASRGHAFILFTSYRMLSWCADYLRAHCAYPLLVQGEQQRSELLQRFVQTENPVLLGTSSFWEGVDVKGDQLRCVIIDKLPFKSPSDPVYRKRLQMINQAGGNAFQAVQIPETTLSLRQGVGRLIRDVNDRGVVVLCDNRLNTRAYGRAMLASLPPMQRADNLDQIIQFLDQVEPA